MENSHSLLVLILSPSVGVDDRFKVFYFAS